MRKALRDRLPQSANLEELFVASVQQTLELAQLLGLTAEEFVETLKIAQQVDQERRAQEKTTEETPK